MFKYWKLFHRPLYLILLLVFSTITTSYAQHPNFIYGQINLKNQTTVSGIIKWVDGQMLWTDVLLASKNTQPFLKFLSSKEIDEINQHNKKSGIDWGFLNLWKDNVPERAVEGICRFGDIIRIHVTGSNDLQVYLKNGNKLRLNTPEAENGQVQVVELYGANARKIALNNISTIEFSSNQPDLVTWKRKPLYGTVYTHSGPITGYISWGKSKVLTSRTLYGRHGDDIYAMKFWDIKRIEKKDKGADIIFNSGKRTYLDATSDVSSAHSGIVVSSVKDGTIIVPWSEFKSVVFTNVDNDKTAYDTFTMPSRLSARVQAATNRIYTGTITFDLDEEWSCELLEGYQRNILYQIPFARIKDIEPLNAKQLKVVLDTNSSYILEGKNEVSAKNWGLIIGGTQTGRKYVDWGHVRKISFH